MENISIQFIVVGSLLLLGLATDYLGRMTSLPRVTLLFLFGFLLGPVGFDLLPDSIQSWLPMITTMALVLVGFVLGGRITISSFKENGSTVMLMSLSVVICTVLIVSAGLLLIGIPLEVALLLAGIATATDPAATLDVISESKAAGKFTDTLQGIVAVDDAWGLVAFSILLAVVHHLNGSEEVMGILATAGYDLIGAVFLGVALGAPMAWISGRIKPGRPTLVEALGIVMLCGGLAILFEVSYLLSSMVLGMVVTNFAKHHEQPFHEIEDIEWPFMILFFVLTGASLELNMIVTAGILTIAYIALRFIGRIIGGASGGYIADADTSASKWMGLALLPQAGVAIGMALLASSQLPSLAGTIIPVVVMATVFFELVGPLFTRLSLEKSGDSGKLQPIRKP